MSRLIAKAKWRGYAARTMAGTAAGMAKARAAKLARLAQSTDSELAVVDAAGDLVGPVAVVAGTAGQPNQAVTVAEALLPDAAALVRKVIRGEVKGASAAVRTNAALDILKMTAKPAQQPGQSPALVDALLAIGRALGVRQPRTFEGGEVVTPTVTTEG